MSEEWAASTEGKVKVGPKGEYGQCREEAQRWKGVGPKGPKLDEELPALGCAKPSKGAASLMADI